MSYGLTIEYLEEVLPIQANVSSVFLMALPEYHSLPHKLIGSYHFQFVHCYTCDLVLLTANST